MGTVKGWDSLTGYLSLLLVLLCSRVMIHLQTPSLSVFLSQLFHPQLERLGLRKLKEDLRCIHSQ